MKLKLFRHFGHFQTITHAHLHIFTHIMNVKKQFQNIKCIASFELTFKKKLIWFIADLFLRHLLDVQWRYWTLDWRSTIIRTGWANWVPFLNQIELTDAICWAYLKLWRIAWRKVDVGKVFQVEKIQNHSRFKGATNENCQGFCRNVFTWTLLCKVNIMLHGHREVRGELGWTGKERHYDGVKWNKMVGGLYET